MIWNTAVREEHAGALLTGGVREEVGRQAHALREREAVRGETDVILLVSWC